MKVIWLPATVDFADNREAADQPNNKVRPSKHCRHIVATWQQLQGHSHLNEGIHLRWEKPTTQGVRYYEVDLHRDLWGEWLLTQAWGRRGARLGRVRVAPCGSHTEGLVRIAVIIKRRRQRRYQLVAGTDPDDDTL